VSQTSWVDHSSGVALQARPETDLNSEIERISSQYKRYGLQPTNCQDHEVHQVLFKLIPAVQRNRADEFRDTLRTECAPLPPMFPAGSLWTDLAEVMARSRYASTLLELPPWRDPELPDLAKATVTAFDDGKKQTMVRLFGGRNLKPAQLTANLTAFDGTEAFALPMDDVKVIDGGRVLQLQFPSIKAWLGSKRVALSIDIACRDCSRDTECTRCTTGEASPMVAAMPPAGGGGQVVLLQSVRDARPFDRIQDLVQQEAAPSESGGRPERLGSRVQAEDDLSKAREQAMAHCQDLVGNSGGACREEETACAHAVSYALLASDDKKTEEKSPGFAIRAGAGSVVTTSHGSGSLDLEFEFDKAAKSDPATGNKPQLCTRAKLSIGGPDVESIESLSVPSVVEDSVQLLIKTSGRIRLDLVNLTPSVPIKVNAECREGLPEQKGGKVKEIMIPVTQNQAGAERP
jgi:hypothetical protein